MRSTRLVCALLLLLAATASAQIPRTINFQGRVRDANNIYLDGQRSCTLKIYDQPAGGGWLFSEIYPVDFDKGTFTINIGARTSGGIPESVGFDKVYWLGLTIEGFNDGQEMLPRMRMSSSPYAFRAEHADLAVLAASAESAKTLEAPAQITGASISTPLIEITNSGPIGLAVTGSTYGVVSTGIDSTSEHYVAGSNAGNRTPAPGGVYRDNAPMAWALINADGSVIGGFGISKITHNPNAPGQYTVTLSTGAALDGTTNFPQMAPMIQLTGLSGSSFGNELNWFFRSGNNRDIFVRIVNNDGGGSDNPFSIIVMGRPE